MSKRAAGWASDFARRAAEARKTWELTKARSELRAVKQQLADVYADDAVDLGEGTGVDARAMIKALQAKDTEAERARRHRAAQKVARGLGDGSLLGEADGTVIVRMRTERQVPAH